MKIEMHFHPSGGSCCANGKNEIAIEKCLKAGYDGVLATTHYCGFHYNDYPGATHKEKVDYFFKVYDEFYALATAKGLKVFLGAEVACSPTETEYILIGFDRKFLYNNPPLFNLTQEELFKIACDNGFFMYQAHPFRQAGVVLGNPKFMHGAESYNGHYKHENRNDLAKEFCLKNGLLELSGTDYHHDDQPFTAGIITNYPVNDEKELIKCIFNKDYKIIE